MGRQSSSAPFNIELLPSEHEVASFNPEDGECCDIDDFKPDLRQRGSSIWNQSVIRIFVLSYLVSEQCEDNDADRIYLHAENHLTYLHNKFKIQLRDPQFRRMLAQRRAREERKRTVCRLTSILHISHPHIVILSSFCGVSMLRRSFPTLSATLVCSRGLP